MGALLKNIVGVNFCIILITNSNGRLIRTACNGRKNLSIMHPLLRNYALERQYNQFLKTVNQNRLNINNRVKDLPLPFPAVKAILPLPTVKPLPFPAVNTPPPFPEVKPIMPERNDEEERAKALRCAQLACMAEELGPAVCACNHITGNVATFKDQCDLKRHNCRFDTVFKVILHEICPWEFKSRRSIGKPFIDYSDRKYYN